MAIIYKKKKLITCNRCGCGGLIWTNKAEEGQPAKWKLAYSDGRLHSCKTGEKTHHAYTAKDDRPVFAKKTYYNPTKPHGYKGTGPARYRFIGGERGDVRTRVDMEEQCSYGGGNLFDTPRCENKATTYLFGEPYCEKCANNLIHIHALFNSGDLKVKEKQDLVSGHD